MADENILPRDQNHVTAAGFENSLVTGDVRPGQMIVATGRIKVDMAGGGGGDVVGPGSSTDNAVARWDGTTGQLLQDSVVIISDLGAITGVTTLTASGLIRSATGLAVEETGAGTDIITIQAPASIAASYTLTLPVDDGTSNQVLTTDGSGVLSWTTPSGTGDVVGPASATDNAVARFDGTTGKLIQNSAVTIADTSGDITAGKYNGLTITASTGTLTIANGKTLTANASTTFAGTDGKTLTISNSGTLAGGDAFVLAIAAGKTLTASNSGTLAGGDAFVLAIAAGKTLTVSNTLTFTGTDGSSVAFGTGGTVLYTTSAIPLTVGTTTIASGTTTRILYDNAGVLGEYTLTGSGTVVVMATSPTFTTGLTTPQVLASSNGSGSLGASGTAFTSLFLASTGTINFAAGNVVLTHSTGILTQTAGELRITSANVGTNADSVPTLSSTSTLTNKTLTSPTIQTLPVLATGTNFKWTVPTGDGTGTGIITNEFNSGYSSTAIGDLVYLDSSGTWQKADADASAATYSGILGIALSVTASASPATVLLQGYVYAATPFPTFTIGSPIYMSATAGAVTQTAPVTTDSATRVIGWAVHADKMWFNPSNDYITHT